MENRINQHRNKCQLCYKQIGRFILDCYCIMCESCFGKCRRKGGPQCDICGKKAKGNCIDVKDEENMGKMTYLFGSMETSLNRAMEIYKFQANIDSRYTKFLERQLSKYRSSIDEIIDLNPELSPYFESKLANKSKHQNSVSQCLPNHNQSVHPRNYYENRPRNQIPTNRSMSNESIEGYNQRMIEGQRVGKHVGADHGYSAKVNYKIPNINYNTALRSSSRPKMAEDKGFYGKR